MTNIILCGGNGTRLWPISRALMPKQFVQLFEKKSLFQLTVERNSTLCEASLIVSNADQYFVAMDQLEELDTCNTKTTFLLEPIGRNTAPAIALACMSMSADETVLITPSDHLIKNQAAYYKAVNRAQELAQQNYLVTFGIKPTFAETGFGYIETDEMNSDEYSENVKAFHEKPNRERASHYFKAGNYYWNSGMFCFKAGVFLEELKKYSPDIFESCETAYAHAIKENITRIKHHDMMNIPEDSIDYAVMEKSDKVKVIPSDIGWSDLGSFDALYDELPKDVEGNTQNPNHISIESKNNFIYSNDRIVATVDIENMIVIDTGDALLISRKGSSQKVKQVVEELKKRNSQLHNIHLTAHRPWGTYTVLEDTSGYKIKRIEVKPGKRLSLQKHLHRNEHWIVVSGTATVTVGDQKKLLRTNESTYIKSGEIHRLGNDGKIPVVLIEAQVGEYTGEDDIIRFDDDYSRISTSQILSTSTQS